MTGPRPVQVALSASVRTRLIMGTNNRAQRTNQWLENTLFIVFYIISNIIKRTGSIWRFCARVNAR